ncbi:MAG: O-antigen ligase family protein [Deltaproteobacteria bacterium]|nr:O-antigen ligase family protein [Deltaproteobacteria bacterium]
MQPVTWWSWVILSGASVVLIFAPLAFAGVHTWAYFSLGVLIALLSLLLLAVLLLRVLWGPWLPYNWPRPPLWGLVLAFLALIILQVIYLPQALVGWLSPEALAIRTLGNGYGLAAAVPLSLNAYATQLELLKLLPAVLLFFLLLYAVRSRLQMRLLVGVILAVALFEVAYGAATLHSHRIWGWKNIYAGFRLSGTFINSNNLGAFLAMAICLGFGLFQAMRPPRLNQAPGTGWRRFIKMTEAERLEPQFRRYALFFLLIVLTAGLILTGSRGAMTSLVFAFVMMGALTWSRSRKRGTLAIMVLFLVLALGYGLFLGAGPALARFLDLQHWGRYCAFMGAFAIFSDFPLVGSGLATFGDLYYQHQPHEINGVFYTYTHNDWLQLLAETGGLGFLLVVGGFLILLYRLIDRWRQRQDYFAAGLGLGGLGALMAVAFHALAEFNLHIPANALLLAAVGALTYLSVHSYVRSHVEMFSYPTMPKPRSKVAAAAILSALLAVQVVFLHSSWRFRQAEQLAPTEINSTVTPRQLTAADYQAAINLNPLNPAYFQGRAAALARTAIDQQTAAEIETLTRQAVFLAPANWRLRLQLADFYLSEFSKQPSRHVPCGLKELAAAVQLFPESAGLQFRLGATLAWAEKYYHGLVPPELRGQSRPALERAIALNPRLQKPAARYLPQSS